MSHCPEGELWTGPWNEVAHEERTGVPEEGSILLKETSMLDRVGEPRRKGRGGEGSPVPSRAWGVGQEHGSLLRDIHLHPSAHLLSASRCQDNLRLGSADVVVAAAAGRGEEAAVAPTASSSVMEGGGLRLASVLGGGGGGTSGTRPPTVPHQSPLPTSRIGSWGSLRRTLTQGQIAGQSWRGRQH